MCKTCEGFRLLTCVCDECVYQPLPETLGRIASFGPWWHTHPDLHTLKRGDDKDLRGNGRAPGICGLETSDVFDVRRTCGNRVSQTAELARCAIAQTATPFEGSARAFGTKVMPALQQLRESIGVLHDAFGNGRENGDSPRTKRQMVIIQRSAARVKEHHNAVLATTRDAPLPLSKLTLYALYDAMLVMAPSPMQVLHNGHGDRVASFERLLKEATGAGAVCVKPLDMRELRMGLAAPEKHATCLQLWQQEHCTHVRPRDDGLSVGPMPDPYGLTKNFAGSRLDSNEFVRRRRDVVLPLAPAMLQPAPSLAYGSSWVEASAQLHKMFYTLLCLRFHAHDDDDDEARSGRKRARPYDEDEDRDGNGKSVRRGGTERESM
jgi:hypothetical protein